MIGRGFVLMSVTLPLLFNVIGCGDDDGPRQLVWNPPDAGIPPRPDATAAVDAASRVCVPLEPLAAESLPRCRASTQVCRLACPAVGGDGCRDACLASDDHPTLMPPGGDPVSCGDCLFQEAFACLSENGCANEVNAFVCCVVEQCASGTPGCIDTECADVAAAAFACGSVRSPACFDEADGAPAACYAEVDPPTGDGGARDGGTMGLDGGTS